MDKNPQPFDYKSSALTNKTTVSLEPLETHIMLLSCVVVLWYAIVCYGIPLVSRLPQIDEIVHHPKTLLLFPGPKAVDMSQFIEEQKNSGCSGPYNLLVLDGTWNQARSIYWQNEFLHSLRQVNNLE